MYMQDIRIERWAHTLVHYCLYVRAEETVSIRATPLAAPLVEAVLPSAADVSDVLAVEAVLRFVIAFMVRSYLAYPMILSDWLNMLLVASMTPMFAS